MATPTRKPESPSRPVSGLVRTQVAALLGVSEPTIRRMEARGELTGWTDPAGVHRFDPDHVAEVAERRGKLPRIPATSQGELAAEVFARLDRGESVRVIVIALKQPPAAVLRLRDQWERAAQATPPRRAELAELDLEGFDAELERARKGGL